MADPTAYGWTFQGVNETSRVAFYERGGVKMDYYYTTGTVKTSMHHPTKGRTQMFRRDLTPREFAAVLESPRAHTGKGYQTRASRPPPRW